VIKKDRLTNINKTRLLETDFYILWHPFDETVTFCVFFFFAQVYHFGTD